MTEVSPSDGTKLRLARQARGLSQQQLAGVAGVTRQAVSAVESGHSDPSLRVALGLARALGPIGAPRPTGGVTGCAPALPQLETPLGRLAPPLAFTWWPCGSGEALRLAAAGLVHAAGVHRADLGEETETGAISRIPGGAE